MNNEQHPSGRQFQPGVSGNPGGRPKGLERLIRETVGDDIVAMTKAQIAIAKGQKPEGCDNLPAIKASDMTKAYEAVVDRGWGKPKQVVELGHAPSNAETDITKMSDEELAEHIRKCDAQAAEGAEGDPSTAPSSGEG